MIKNKTILVTGGTGSFGKYIVSELLKYNPSEIRIFSRDEDKQYSMQFELKDYKNLRFVIGDVRDKESLQKATKNVDIVLHAAALKQIPSTEYNILEAVKTNVLGAQNVVDACLQNNVKKVLSISTDKAVEPINVMGMTKGLQERIFTLANKERDGGQTVFASVRYGNVVASRGSVIPLFIKQIKAGGPLTITHPGMTRFILTLKRATQLVFTALSAMVGGEIFVPKVQPLRIIDLAEVFVEAYKPVNNKIVAIGIRPGEKLHETLISDAESLRIIDKGDYFILLPQIDLQHIGYTYELKMYAKKKILAYSSDKGPFLTKVEIKDILRKDNII